jgi:5,5'-dehydrodivanillate O-demethylase oxygenase subunit
MLDEFLTGPQTPGGRFMRTFWQPVARSADVIDGQAVPLRILGEKFTLYRGETGRAHLVDFACAHRGTQLSTGSVEGDCIRCLYHGWRYDADGQCVEQPGEDDGFASKVRIKTYPLEEYLGLIFVYLGDANPAPPLRRFPELEEPGVLLVDPAEVWPCNFLNRLDNDMAHVPWTHRESLKRVGQTVGHNTYAQTYVETDFGVADPTGIGNPHVLPNINILRVPLRGNDRWAGLFLNRLIFVVPIDDDNSIAFDITFAPGLVGEEAEAFKQWRAPRLFDGDLEDALDIAREILAGKRSIRDVPSTLSREKQFMIEDYVTQVGQGRLCDRAPEHLGRNDALIILFRKLWRREVQALEANEPLKAWSSTGLWKHQTLRPPAQTFV